MDGVDLTAHVRLECALSAFTRAERLVRSGIELQSHGSRHEDLRVRVAKRALAAAARARDHSDARQTVGSIGGKIDIVVTVEASPVHELDVFEFPLGRDEHAQRRIRHELSLSAINAEFQPESVAHVVAKSGGAMSVSICSVTVCG